MKAYDALILALPAHRSTVRMRVWRALKEHGCAVLHDGVYLLPPAAARNGVLAAVDAEVRAAGGSAMRVELRPRTVQQRAHIRKLFDRGADFAALQREAGSVQTALPRLGLRGAGAAVQRLRRRFDRLAQTDFFPGRPRRRAEAAVVRLEKGFRNAYLGGEPRAARKRLRALDPAGYRGRVWATRRDLWVDRLASAWLIRRFIDPAAKFVWIGSPRERPRDAVGFDFDGAEFTHAGSRVTFEVLLASFGLGKDPALAAIASAVHYLDVGGKPVAVARGLETLLRGIKQRTRNDDALLAEAMRALDHFHSACA